MTTAKPVNPRSITTEERDWIEACIVDPSATYDVLFDAVQERETARLANNVWSYIFARAHGKDPGVSQPSKSGYRKILGRLADEGVTPPPVVRRDLFGVTPLPYNGRRSSMGAGGGNVRSTPVPAAKRRKAADEGGYVQLVLPLVITAVAAAAGVAHAAPMLAAGLVDAITPRINVESDYVTQADAIVIEGPWARLDDELVA